MSHWVLDADELQITVTAGNQAAESLVKQGLADLQLAHSPSPQGIELKVEQLNGEEWQLEDVQAASVRKLSATGDLIYHLSDRIIYHLADKLEQRHCLHAAAVQVGNAACVIPAKSGAGKSSLTAWLVANQFPYITDELILVDADSKISGIARPIQIKSAGLSVIEPMITGAQPVHYGALANAITVQHLGGVVAQPNRYEIGLFLFPQYDDQASFEMTRLSSAEAGLNLMSNHVNARNLQDHGFRAMMKLIRETPCFSLHYGGFDYLPEDFAAQLNDIASTI